MSTTQQHLAISDIQNNILLLKGGGGALVLQVSAVNFGLLSEREQIAIITSFAQMLNSLSFSIQITIHSVRLNIASYLELLDKAQKAQSNPLLSQMITEYKQFIQATIKDNEVLDKKFYIVIPLFALELGLRITKESLEQKVKTILLPRRDQVVRQLARVGLRVTQLDKTELIKLFYNIYNGETLEKAVPQEITPEELAVRLKQPQPIQENQESRIKNQGLTTPLQTQSTTSQPPIAPRPTAQDAVVAGGTQQSRTHPFVVEELT